VARRRQALPWFELKAVPLRDRRRRASLADFSEALAVLIYHYMFGPDYSAGCATCRRSLMGSTAPSFIWRTTTSRFRGVAAPLAKLQAYKRRMGWTFPWASSFGGDFNFRLSASFTEDNSAR